MANALLPATRNFYTFEKHEDLVDANGSHFGFSLAQYEIHLLRKVTNGQSLNGYAIALKQRIVIPSRVGYQPGPYSTNTYQNYPAVLENSVSISVNEGALITLHHMFPKTLNSQVSTSISSDHSGSTNSSVEHSTGSSTTNVNTFGVSVSAGIFGELPVANVTADYSHSWEASQSRGTSVGTSTGMASSIGSNTGMSIKDWSSYGALDAAALNPCWIWAQSYPWDVVRYTRTDDGSSIDLPDFVKQRLTAGANYALPPSDLSLFGLDFTMTAAWAVYFPGPVSSEQVASIAHVTRCYEASHTCEGTSVTARLDTQSGARSHSYAVEVPLSDYGLEPILSPNSDNGAAIGFLANPFITPPASAATTFKILSPANRLQVTGSGFDEVMHTSFAQPVKLKATFKITDTVNNYALLLMHWVDEKTGPCLLDWTVNGQWVGQIQVSAGGGQNNVSSIELRDTDFTSVNFHDYLLVGTNVVEIAIAPATPGGCTGYTLFAMAIGRT